MAILRRDIGAAAESDAKVLLTGETGSGKEVVAQAIHSRSRRHDRPFVTINCAGIPDTLLESEFFGHARGSFTGAMRDSPGLLRQAEGGTVLLDEVGEMSLRLQALLLRFLETGEIQTVGGGVTRAVDVRVIAATNRNLQELAAAREFREDLYYGLNVFHIVVAPLRERRQDIPLLLDHDIDNLSRHHGRPPVALSDRARDLLVEYSWPGNVRELRNLVERLVVSVRGAVVEPEHLSRDVIREAAAAPAPGADPYQLAEHRARVEQIVERLLEKRESFWTSAYPAFMARDITRTDMRIILQAGLERTHGSYRVLLGLFNMDPDDYKRFLRFLTQHDCHLPFQRFRTSAEGARGGEASRAAARGRRDRSPRRHRAGRLKPAAGGRAMNGRRARTPPRRAAAPARPSGRAGIRCRAS